MASLIQGYKYDIFISYRQKDNKGEKWVSEFVEALKTELESTIKEEISVYFDINPQDGLLETHDVDASLKDKLKCLVFIPIISHTYCDPKSYAWVYELKAFLQQASSDQYGLKVKLPNGNIGNRVLPVMIHDLDMEDINLYESTSGGAIRGVEFIYKSPGVNRPLRAREDKLQDNLNKTIYRDQINKVANAIKEIVSGITTGEVVSEIEKPLAQIPSVDVKIDNKQDTRGKPATPITLDRKLLKMIENDFPYPLALEFRRLNTKEYLAHDENRLRQILKISETTIHLVALISLVDLLENTTKSIISIPAPFKIEFPAVFASTSFSKWISLAKECIKLFLKSHIPMFIIEIPQYFFDKNGYESKALEAFNILSDIRNELSHSGSILTNKVIEDYCMETEKHMETILLGLEFLMNYSFLYVDHISVKYRKWNSPSFCHTFSEVTGNSSEFNAYNKILSEIVNTPALIIIKGGEEKNYLNLDPVLIYSNEGENKIADVFMYVEWDKSRSAKYKPVWNGGSFNLSGTTIEIETVNSLLKFFEYFSERDVYQGYRECIEKLKVSP